MSDRFNFVEIRGDQPPVTFCRAVTVGLGNKQKSIPTHFLYDRAGSELFEQITELPEYYPTRTERTILEKRVNEIVESVGSKLALIEFGSGSCSKTCLLIDAILRRQDRLSFSPIDISFDFLKSSSLDLLKKYPELDISALGAEYFDAAERLPSHDGPRLVLFLGSNIGNLEREEAVEFLGRIRNQMTDEDRLLIGIDLVKDRDLLERAYNDAEGITAQFNKNLLLRMNRELDGHFDDSRFVHYAPYDEIEQRIEMRLASAGSQIVNIDAIDRRFSFEDHEFIHTEWSHKYTPASFANLVGLAGLDMDHLWTDDQDWFGLAMLKSTAAGAD